jgi:hypothetical protein
MNSTELIAQADRRYVEIRGESRGWGQASWCNGYIQGWLEHRAPAPDALVAEARIRELERNRDETNRSWRDDHVELLARAEAAEIRIRELEAQMIPTCNYDARLSPQAPQEVKP